MNFRSDNTAPAAPEIIAALTRVNEGAASAYGEDQWSKLLDEKFSALFERDVRVFTVASGTAANAISVASLTAPWGAVLCHRESHIECDECGATEFYSGGAKLVLIDGDGAKVSPEALSEAISRNDRGVHSVKPFAVSVSQATERGAVYQPSEIAALGKVAKDAGLGVHMDGARFGNAVAALGCRPADVTWRAGVDLLSFGATKNGAITAEAIVCFDPARAEEIARRRKRSGHLLSKGRFVAAQLLAYLEDDLWLRLARRSNALAAQLAHAASSYLSHPAETNQIFIKPGAAALERLRAAGAEFYDWGAAGSGEARLVVSWDQGERDIEAMRGQLASLR
ncbi:threonine aldolase family protein [Candidatus Viadribacter manganicus]|uniref:L-threonine aldolase n=1 Tax=Candidatus Viadribacter manganicus TaxID=1759059 RepID=A0A1B1AFP5_9PROT|nr:beta-eliminating lyase-related protein [Candidatus Viadribacter manganicus]ANP45406.1 threonine aldolase [Candidatus Viadribacter manganicus]